MTYFPDLSPYCYSHGDATGAKNIGWLQRGHEFETMVPSDETLDLLWNLCSVPVQQTRGIHTCDLCTALCAINAERDGIARLLGSAEIRVFSRENSATALEQRIRQVESGGLMFIRSSPVTVSVFAAPTLIYHYVETHHYKPPDEFLRALNEGPRPPDQEYFDRLKKLELTWNSRSQL